jgi:UDP-glucose 4-epimerase
VDNLVNGRLQNLEAVRKAPRFDFVELDVASSDRIAAAMAGVEQVYHLAALADIVPSIQDPLRYHRANVDGTVAVLEGARRAGVRRFVYAASASCYGIPERYPTPEDAPIRPLYPYALTKWIGEQYVLHWQQTYGLAAVSLRLFNVYGPRSRTSGTYGAVLGVFLAQKLAGEPFTVVGDGSQTRDFTFVSDVVEAMLGAARSELSGEVFNVGSGDTYSVNRLVELLGGEVVHIPKRPGEPDCTFADISRIERQLGWRPRVSFEDGIAEMLRRIDHWADAPVWNPSSIADATREWFEHLDPQPTAEASAAAKETDGTP